MVSANASAKTVLTDFLSVPKIIGTGPIMMTPAPRTFPLAPPRVEARIRTMTMITIPTTINAKASA
ncbi:MAG: hypothetical protein NWE95_02925 [Candidatus Bathyarchaeota archaeon]|nr:hypothetical protein [Candidatus Bathyarchaeota archaeon]